MKDAKVMVFRLSIWSVDCGILLHFDNRGTGGRMAVDCDKKLELRQLWPHAPSKQARLERTKAPK